MMVGASSGTVILKKILHEHPGDAVMVGDSDTDMETAANSGITGIAVNWGYRDMSSIENLKVANSVEELFFFLKIHQIS